MPQDERTEAIRRTVIDSIIEKLQRMEFEELREVLTVAVGIIERRKRNAKNHRRK